MNIFGKVQELRKRILKRKTIHEFVGKPAKERAALTKANYTFQNTKDRYIAFFDSGIDIKNNVQLFFDICVGVCNGLDPKVVRQIGCWTGTESKFLADSGFSGKLEATDFDAERIEFLTDRYASGPYSAINFFTHDIENVKPGDYEGVSAVVAQAVLSNIQPEYLEPLLKTMSEDGVDLILIGDCYVKETLSLSPNKKSIISPVDMNWFHPYLSLGRKLGYEVLFVPDFMYSSFHVARGIFILYRNFEKSQIADSMKGTFASYFERQEGILNHYEGVDMNKPYDIEKKD